MAIFTVTGGAGFIGSHLADALLAEAHEVRVLDDLSSGRMENLDPRCEVLRGDICDVRLLRAASIWPRSPRWRGRTRIGRAPAG